MTESAEVRRESAEPVSAEFRESAAYPVGEADYSDSPPGAPSAPNVAAAESHGITALCIAERSMRAHYVYMRDGQVVHRRDNVIGYAALGGEVYGLRIELATGRGVLVGSRLDPDRDHLMAVLTAGQDLEDVPGVDERIRQMVLDSIGGPMDSVGDEDAAQG